MKPKGKRQGRAEHWTQMIRAAMEEPAWRALSTTAQALYPWLKLEWHGKDYNNNGKIQLSVRQAAERLGVTPDTAGRAFHDLQRKGWIVQTAAACLGIEGSAKSPSYELTELKMPGSDLNHGRKLYQEWREGQDFSVAEVMANNPQGRNGKRAKPCHANHDDPVTKSMTKLRAMS